MRPGEVRFMHIGHKQPVYHGVITAAFSITGSPITGDGEFRVGVALCSPKESNFSRKKGRLIAQRRMESKRFSERNYHTMRILPSGTFEEKDPVTLQPRIPDGLQLQEMVVKEINHILKYYAPTTFKGVSVQQMEVGPDHFIWALTRKG